MKWERWCWNGKNNEITQLLYVLIILKITIFQVSFLEIEMNDFIDCKLVWKIRKVPYINRKFHTFQSSICMLGLDATQFFIHNIESFQKLPHEMFNNNSYRVELIKYYINFSTSVGFFCFLFPQCPEARQLFFPDGIIHEQIIFWLPKYHG